MVGDSPPYPAGPRRATLIGPALGHRGQSRRDGSFRPSGAQRKGYIVTRGLGAQRFPGGAAGYAGAHRSWRLLASWLAVLAILVQTVVPDLAMAARGRVARAEPVAAAPTAGTRLQGPSGTHEHDHSHERAGAPAVDPASTPKAPTHHDHGAACPFCMALAAHALTPTPNVGLSPIDADASDPVLPDTRIAARRPGHTPLNPRAPPAFGRV